MGGWLKNQEQPAERNLLVVIPGQDRSRAVIMADHYDTAYMPTATTRSTAATAPGWRPAAPTTTTRPPPP